MSEAWVNVDGVRPADTAKFARRVEAALAMGFRGLRVSSANANYGPQPAVYDTAGVDAWVDICAPTGLKNRIILLPSWNHNHAAWIAVAGTYGVDFPTPNRPQPTSPFLEHVVSRDSSLINRWATRWVQKGGRIEDLSVELHGEDCLYGVLGPRESGTLTTIADQALIGVRDTQAEWTGPLGFAGVVGIVEWMEAFCPLMDWSGLQVVAPVMMGHIYSLAQASAAGVSETGPWPARFGNASGLGDSLSNELGTAGLLRYVDADAPWWAAFGSGQLEWSIGAYLGVPLALSTLSPSEIGRMYRATIAARERLLRAHLAETAETLASAGVPHEQIDSGATVHVYEYGITRGWVTGSSIYTGPRRAHSEDYFGRVIGAIAESVCALSGVQSAALYDLENRAASLDAPSGHASSYGLMRASDGALSVGAVHVGASLGASLSTSEDSPSGAWWE